jgi:hypothetical protein
MGMDVIGRAPSGDSGNYFPMGSRGWDDLIDYCEAVAPNI